MATFTFTLMKSVPSGQVRLNAKFAEPSERLDTSATAHNLDHFHGQLERRAFEIDTTGRYV